VHPENHVRNVNPPSPQDHAAQSGREYGDDNRGHAAPELIAGGVVTHDAATAAAPADRAPPPDVVDIVGEVKPVGRLRLRA